MLPWIDYSLDNSTLYPRIIMIQPSPKSSRKPGLAEQTWNKRSGRCQWVGWYCCFCLPGLLVPTFCSWTDMFLTQLGMTLFFSMTVDHLTQDCPGVSFFFCPVFYYEHQFLILFLTGVYSSLEFQLVVVRKVDISFEIFIFSIFVAVMLPFYIILAGCQWMKLGHKYFVWH